MSAARKGKRATAPTAADTRCMFSPDYKRDAVRLALVGDRWDNAVAESFFATLKRELVDRVRWRTRDEARAAISTYIESWYNRHRRHSSLGFLSPIDRRFRRGSRCGSCIPSDRQRADRPSPSPARSLNLSSSCTPRTPCRRLALDWASWKRRTS